MSITGHRAYWAILFGCLVLFITIIWFVWWATTVQHVYTQIHDMSIEMSWMECSRDEIAPGNKESTTLLDSFQASAGTAHPPICTIEDEVVSANGVSGRRLYLISMSQDQFTTFRQAVISHGADQIDPPENPDVVPLWWNPPKVECLRWDYGRAHATYDSSRQLLFFRNYRLNSEKFVPKP